MRKAGHPCPGRVPRSRLDATTTGFVLEVEEEWDQDGESWYFRELLRADVADGAISHISVYCTGDWDRAQDRPADQPHVHGHATQGAVGPGQLTSPSALQDTCHVTALYETLTATTTHVRQRCQVMTLA